MENKYDELYEKLTQLQLLLQRYQVKSKDDHGIFSDKTRGQGRVLAMLKLQPEISTKDLSYLLGIRQQSLNELLNKLEKAEYVVRIPSESDRRVMIVKLTEKGRAQQQDTTDHSQIFSTLSSEEQKAFSSYLDKVLYTLASQQGLEEAEDFSQWFSSAQARFEDDILEQLISMGDTIRRKVTDQVSQIFPPHNEEFKIVHPSLNIIPGENGFKVDIDIPSPTIIFKKIRKDDDKPTGE